MPSHSNTFPPLLFLAAMLAGEGSAAPGPTQGMALDVETLLNTLDGSVLGDCTVQSKVEAGKSHHTWITFGSVKPRQEQGWEGVTSVTRCADGSFDSSIALVPGAAGVPYLSVGIETVSLVQRDRVDLQATLTLRRLVAFDEQRRPVYATDELNRRFDLGPGEFAVIPLLIADLQEQDAFNVRELYLRLYARALGREAAAYGAISVMVDVPGLDIQVDGGVVGRSLERNPVVLKNIRAGRHEVRVIDLSGRVASRQLVVKKDRTVEANLKILDLPPQLPAAMALVPIGKNPQGYSEFWRVQDGAAVVKVPAGEFVMGSGENEGEPQERPQRRLFVSEFLVDKTQVTWRQFRRYAEATSAPLPPAPLWGMLEDYPATSVLYREANAYCEWVGGRLPTEAEWEKAARGTDGRKYLWGNDWDPDRCNSIDGGPHRPKGVGSFPACVSPYGVIDMAGSVWEWSADWYADHYPELSEQDPKGPDSGTLRVVRGGSWLSSSFYLRTAYRHKIDPNWRNVHNGFRCAQNAAR